MAKSPAADMRKRSGPVRRDYVKVRLQPTTRAANKFGGDINARILALRLETGQSPRKIAEQLHCGKTMVYRVLAENLNDVKAHLN